MQTHHLNQRGIVTRTSGSRTIQDGNGPPSGVNGLQDEDQDEPKVNQQMLSQDSLANYAEDAEKEAILERKRLALQDSERKQFANAIISQTSHHNENGNQAVETGPTPNQGLVFSFGKSAPKNRFGRKDSGSTKKERLEELLQKTEQYTKFILQQNIKHHRAMQRQQFAESILNGDMDGHGAKMNGKSSISKRRQNKRPGQNAAENSSEEEDQGLITRLTSQPSIMDGQGHTLRDYQLDGLNWMVSLYETGINGILADEMGLGKTIQTISLISFLKEFKKIDGYHLIIMPKSVVGNWMKEFAKWMPQCRVLNLIARKEAREQIVKNDLQPGKFDVVITTFEGVRLCMGPLMKYTWEYIIIDEAHKIKNEDSQTSKRIRQFKSKYRLLLTGTPLQNNLHELWSLLNFLLPEIFVSSDDFDEWFNLGSKANESLTDKEKEEKNQEMIKQLHKILRPFMLRRIKREVEKSLLPKIEMHITVGITEVQKSIYRQLLKKSTIEKQSSTSHYKNILVQLRKVCDHPYLFSGIEPEDAPELGEHIIKTSGKMLVLDKLLLKAKVDNSQSLIFSGFTSMLDILEDYCRFRGFKYCRLDGNTELDDRQLQIDDFTSPETDKEVFLISTRAGGLGLNLMTANTVVLYDSDWNPQMDLQAMDRAHRIGQTKQVKVYRLITKNTMEVKMVEKQTMKLKLDQMIIQKGRVAPKNQGMAKNDLQDMVNYGADSIFEIGSDCDDGDIEDLIKQGEENAYKLQKQAEDVMKQKFDMVNFEMNSCNLYQFEDVDYLKEKRKDAEDLLKKNVIALMETETNLQSRRKVQKNLAENNLCPNIFGNGNIGVSNDAKKKKLAKVQDFRFFPDPERLKELIELELESKYSGYIQGQDIPIFTPEMKIEKELIESKGFPDWDRRDFQKFIQALENYATDDYANISKHMDGTKSIEEVEEYATVFFLKIDTLNDRDKIKAKINKAQKNVNFNLKAPELIRNKVGQYENPIEDMNFTFATQKSKYFNRETDIYLVCLTNKLGYGNWTKIKNAVRRDTRCRLDHLFISRSEEELKKRVIYLVQCLEKEEETKRIPRTMSKPTYIELEAQFDKLLQEAEQKAEETINDPKNLTLNSLIRMANYGLDGFLQQNKAAENSQDSKLKSEKSSHNFSKVGQKKQNNDSENEMDREMNEDQMNDYDDLSQNVSSTNNKKAVNKKKSKSKKKENERSQSGDSINRFNGQAKEVEVAIDEDMEEDELLQRELGGDDTEQQSQSQKQIIESQGRDSKIGSNGNTTTDSNIQVQKPDEEGNKQAKNSANGVPVTSTKSIKQSNLAEWVSSSTPNKNNNQLVGQKRTTSRMTGALNNNGINGKVANHKSVSDFNVDK